MYKLSFLITIFLIAVTVEAQSNEFTYQGRLNDSGVAATGSYDIEFRLFNALDDGTQQGPTLTFDGAGGNPPPVQVTNGVFTVRLDFGAEFTGAERFLEISVRPAGTGSYATLTPRQPLTSTPYAVHSATAENVSGVVAIANGGTGSSTQNFVDTSTDQTSIGGNKTFTGVLSISDGSAAAPAMTFSGDSDTGFFRSAPDTLRFSTGGVSRMVIDPSGRVGVGTEIFSNPIRFSAVEDNPSAPSAYGVYGQAIGVSGFRAGVVGQTFFTDPAQTNTTGFGLYGFANGANFNTGVYGFSQGAGAINIGIFGTASGATQNWAGFFQGDTKVSNTGIVRSYINSDSNAGVALTLNDQPGWSVATANTGHFQIFNDAIGQNAFWIDKTTNNTGIGTFAPGAKLDVAGSINSLTQYNIGGNRILGNPGSLNLFAGVNAGFSNGSAAANTFVGDSAGRLNVTGSGNSYFGRAAGENSTSFGNSFFGATAGQFATGANSVYVGGGSGRGTSDAIPNSGGENAFFGYQSGMVNTSGNLNSFFGGASGRANTTGIHNAFFGAVSGGANVNGSANAFFGMLSGDSNIDGSQNAFFGYRAGDVNTSGHLNVFLGTGAGQSNTAGNFNTMVGAVANVSVDNLEYATAIGARANVGTSDTIVIGKTAGTYDSVARPADTVQIPGNLNLLGTLTANGSGITNLNASNITTGTLPIARGGTGSTTQNFVDLTTNQANIGGNKTFTGSVNVPANGLQVGSDQIVTSGGSVGIGTGPASAKLHVAGTDFYALRAENTFVGAATSIGVFGRSVNNPGFGTGGAFTGGNTGVQATADATTFSGNAYGLFGSASGSAGFRFGVVGAASGTGSATTFGVYGTAGGGATNWAGYFLGNTHMSGNLGLGTTNPTERLDVVGNIKASGTIAGNGSGLTSLNAANVTNGILSISNGGTGSTTQNFVDLTTNQNSIGGNKTFAGTVSIGTGPTAGSIELSTSSPTSRVYVHNGGGVSVIETLIGTSNAGIDIRSPSSGYARSIALTDNNSGGLRFRLANFLNFSGPDYFTIRDDNAGVDRLIIGADGSVGIGTTTPDQLLTVGGNASKIGGGSWSVFSDERLKKVNGRFTRGIADLMRLDPIRFEYRPDNALGLRGAGEYVGFSAQEVERVIPEAVSRGSSGYLQINNDPILWTTLNAVKEQQAQIESQQKTIEQQQKQIDALKKFICAQNPKADICAVEDVKR